MKNTMLLMIAAIVALFALALALYGASTSLPGLTAGPGNDTDTGTATPSPEEIALSGGPKTALSALAVSSIDPTVKAWTDDRNLVSIARIASDFCSEGLSDTWMIVYATDDGQALDCVVGDGTVESRQSVSSYQPGFDPDKAMDSDEIWQTVADEITASGSEIPQSVSMTLKISDGELCWDVSYDAADGYHIVRLDAMNGTITNRVTVGQG
jgi:hypothetical protein